MTQQQQQPRPKAVPHPNAETQVYWDKANEDELWIQRCIDCGGKPYFYPRFFCPTCLGTNVEWFRTSGKGKLHTYMINQRPAPGFEAEAPYAIAVVELDEGVRMMTNIQRHREHAGEPGARYAARGHVRRDRAGTQSPVLEAGG